MIGLSVNLNLAAGMAACFRKLKKASVFPHYQYLKKNRW